MKGFKKPLQHELASDFYRRGFGPSESYKKLQMEFGLPDVVRPETFRTWWRNFRKNFPRGGLLDQPFSWEKMDEGGIDIPWEASRQIFDVLAVLEHARGDEVIGFGDDEGLIVGLQPRVVLTFRVARWYWRVCLATPDLDLLPILKPKGRDSENNAWEVRDSLVRQRLLFAELMAALEIKKLLVQSDVDFWPVVWRLVFEPWRFTKDKELYQSRVASELIPDLNETLRFIQTGVQGYDARMIASTFPAEDILREAFMRAADQPKDKL